MADLSKMSTDELRSALAAKKAKLEEVQANLARPQQAWTDQAQDIMDKLFQNWHVARDWLKDTHVEGRENLFVESLIGMRRHLYAYLHDSRKVMAALNRRGPNASIQGLASQVGVVASWLIEEEVWRTFTRNGIDLGFAQHNIVHDALVFESHFEAIPICVYLIEHGMTTLVMDHYERVYGVRFQVPFGFGLEVGLNEADTTEWEDQRFDTLQKLIIDMHEKVMARQAADPTIRLDPMRMNGGRWLTEQSLDDALDNLDRIATIRRKELRTDPFVMTLKGKTGWYLDNMYGLVGSDRQNNAAV